MSIYFNKRVLVTGHTGFKGSWLVSILESFGAKTAGFSLAPTSGLNHFELLNLYCDSNIGDINNLDSLAKSINDFQPEIVFHLAAQPLVRESYRNPLNTYKTNVIGTLNMLEVARKCSSIKAIVVVTTDKVYENMGWVFPYRENDQLGGYDIYSSSKAATEILVKSYQSSFFNVNDYKLKHNILIATARGGNVIGGGDWSSDRLIPDLIKSTVSKKSVNIRSPFSIRPWQHVLDCLSGYLKLGEKLLNGQIEFSGAWNFCPNANDILTVKEVVDSSKNIWDKIEVNYDDDNLGFHEASVLKLDNTKSISLLKWNPQYSTHLAIHKTIDWYKTFYCSNVVITKNQIDDYFKNS